MGYFLKGSAFLLRQQKMTGISNMASLTQGLLSRIVASQHPAIRASLDEEEKKALPESRQTFQVAAARTSGLNNLVFSRQTGHYRPR